MVSTVALIGGFAVWYSLKYAVLFRGTKKIKKSTYPYILACVFSLLVNAIIWILPNCSYELHRYTGYTVIASAAAFAVDIIESLLPAFSNWTRHEKKKMSPAHAAVCCTLVYTSGHAIQSNPMLICEAVSYIFSVWSLCFLAYVARQSAASHATSALDTVQTAKAN